MSVKRIPIWVACVAAAIFFLSPAGLQAASLTYRATVQGAKDMQVVVQGRTLAVIGMLADKAIDQVVATLAIMAAMAAAIKPNSEGIIKFDSFISSLNQTRRLISTGGALLVWTPICCP